jgi:hypothetical protein
MLFGSAVGFFAVYKTGPIRKEMATSYGIMRKPWMRFPLPLAIFLFTYNVATQVPQRFGRKASVTPSVTHDTYTGQNDLVGRFRLFDKDPVSSADQRLASYVSTYSTEALTEPEVLSSLSKVAEAHASVDKTMRVKRLGPDLDDNYWMFGKIHGLENIAYLTDEEVAACNGNPVAL